MSLGASILPLFEQLGLLEDLKKIALPCHCADMYSSSIKKVATMEFKHHDKL